MAKNPITLQFYNVSQCGLFPFGKAPLFDGFSKTIDEFHQWVSALDFANTTTNKISEENLNDLLQTYCFDIDFDKATKDYFITTWNRIPSSTGGVPVVKSGSKVGEAQVSVSAHEPDDIPGFPTYFWIIPTRNLIATVKFKSQVLNGHKNFINYMKGFLQWHSSPVSHKIQEDGTIKSVITDIKGRDIIVIPQLISQPLREKGKISFIENNSNNIRKFCVKSVTSTTTERDKSTLDTLMSYVGLGQKKLSHNDIAMSYSVETAFSKAEISQLIADYEEKTSKNIEINYGFIFTGHANKIHWLGDSLVKSTIEEHNLKTSQAGIYNLGDLSQLIIKNRESLLSALEAPLSDFALAARNENNVSAGQLENVAI